MSKVEICGLKINLTRKDTKNAYLRVDNKSAEIKLSAPYSMPKSEIEEFVSINKSKLIQLVEKAQNKIQKEESIEPHFRGKQVNFHLKKARSHSFQLFEEDIVINYANSKAIEDIKKEAIIKWQSNHLYHYAYPKLKYWAEQIGVHFSGLKISKMKTRWGTCNVGTKQITLSVMLANKPSECIEYVIVHELVHLLEASHNHRFKALMSNYLPNWKDLKAKLNQ
jgi:predicted metal-dependent hydrolase